jgi:organic hydroperoxide reductase OsmC/OhrA
MRPFPHRYVVSAIAGTDGEVILESGGLPTLPTTVPPEFGGPEDRWSPETLLVGAVADCYALTFRGIAKRLNLPWTSLVCEVAGTLDRVQHVTKFVELHVAARLQVPEGTNIEDANRVLVRAEETCLITRSLSAAVFLNTAVEIVKEACVG